MNPKTDLPKADKKAIRATIASELRLISGTRQAEAKPVQAPAH
jgi:hypothetical protein